MRNLLDAARPDVKNLCFSDPVQLALLARLQALEGRVEALEGKSVKKEAQEPVYRESEYGWAKPKQAEPDYSDTGQWLAEVFERR